MQSSNHLPPMIIEEEKKGSNEAFHEIPSLFVEEPSPPPIARFLKKDGKSLLTDSGTFNDYPAKQRPKTDFVNLSALETMKAAVIEVGPRVYNIDLKGNDKVRIIVLGCQGQGKGKDKKSPQEEIAELINSLSEDEKNAPILVLGLGDNLYDYGAYTPDDPAFKECFHDIYKHIKLPFYLILGNHDDANCEKAYYYNKWVRHIPMGDAAGINELAHTYGNQGKEELENETISAEKKERKLKKIIEQRITEHTQETVDPSKLSGQFNIPYYFYSLITGDTQIFCLDSNTFGTDFIDFFQGKTHATKVNQFAWLTTEYAKAKAAGRKTVFAQHQFLFTNGKRLDKFDTHHYLDSGQIKLLNTIIKKVLLLNLIQSNLAEATWIKFKEYAKNLSFEVILETCKGDFTKEQIEFFQNQIPEDTNEYAELVARMYDCLQLQPDLLLSAHDHYMGYFNNKLDSNAKRKFCQFTCGGGGGHKQHPKSLHGRPYATTLSDYGVGVLSYDARNPQEFDMKIYTPDPAAKAENKIIPKLQLAFTDKDHLPKHDVVDKEPTLETLRELVLKICDDFITHKQKQEIEAKKKNPAPTQSQDRSLSGYSKYSLFNLPSATLSYLNPSAWLSKKENPSIAEQSNIENKNASIPEQITSFFKSYIKPIANMVSFANHSSITDEIICVNKLQLYFQQPVTPPLDQLVNYLIQSLNTLIEKEKTDSLFKTFKTSLTGTDFFQTTYGNYVTSSTPVYAH